MRVSVIHLQQDVCYANPLARTGLSCAKIAGSKVHLRRISVVIKVLVEGVFEEDSSLNRRPNEQRRVLMKGEAQVLERRRKITSASPRINEFNVFPFFACSRGVFQAILLLYKLCCFLVSVGLLTCARSYSNTPEQQGFKPPPLENPLWPLEVNE